MKPSDRDYLLVRQYWTFWAVDFSSPSVGLTLKTGTEADMKAEYARLYNLNNDELRREILGK